MYRCHSLTHIDLLFSLLHQPDFVSVDFVGDFVSKQFTDSWAFSEDEGCGIRKCCFSVNFIDFWMLIDADANEVSKGLKLECILKRIKQLVNR